MYTVYQFSCAQKKTLLNPHRCEYFSPLSFVIYENIRLSTSESSHRKPIYLFFSLQYTVLYIESIIESKFFKDLHSKVYHDGSHYVHSIFQVVLIVQ